MHNQIDYYKNLLKQISNYYIKDIQNTNPELTTDKDAIDEYPELKDFNKLLTPYKKTTPGYKIIMDDSLSINHLINPEVIKLKENTQVNNLDEFIINKIQDKEVDHQKLEHKLTRLIKTRIVIDSTEYLVLNDTSMQSIKDEFESFYEKEYEILKDFSKEIQNYNVLINKETLQIETVYNKLFAEYDNVNKILKIKTDTQALADYKRSAKTEEKIPKLPPAPPAPSHNVPPAPPLPRPNFPPPPPAYGPPPRYPHPVAYGPAPRPQFPPSANAPAPIHETILEYGPPPKPRINPDTLSLSPEDSILKPLKYGPPPRRDDDEE